MTTAAVPAEGLFDRAREGDRTALDELLRLHRDSVAAVCRRRLRSRVDADDAVQETMVRAIGALAQVRDEARLKSYLCRIAERVCLDMMRAGARPMPAALAPADADSAEHEALRRHEAELVRQTLQALSARQAEALWMRDAMGEGVPAVAEHLGMTEGSTRVLLTRARKSMRDGWAKVAAMLPGLGIKLPAPVAKLLTSGVAIPAVVAPAVLIAAVVLVVPVVEGGHVSPSGQLPGVLQAAPQTGVARAAGDLPAVNALVTRVPTTTAGAEVGGPARSDGRGGAAATSGAVARVGTGAAGDVVVDFEDPGQGRDDVTAGDDGLVEVGSGIEDVLGGVGADLPPLDLTTDAFAE